MWTRVVETPLTVHSHLEYCLFLAAHCAASVTESNVLIFSTIPTSQFIVFDCVVLNVFLDVVCEKKIIRFHLIFSERYSTTSAKHIVSDLDNFHAIRVISISFDYQSERLLIVQLRRRAFTFYFKFAKLFGLHKSRHPKHAGIKRVTTEEYANSFASGR